MERCICHPNHPKYFRGEIKNDFSRFFDDKIRITAALSLYFLEKNGVLYVDGEKVMEDRTVVILTIMIADSRSEEKEIVIGVIMN